MADTGFRRFKVASNIIMSLTEGEIDNLAEGGNGVAGTDDSGQGTRGFSLRLLNASGDTAKDDLGIPEGSIITGIEFKVKAKYTGVGGTAPTLKNRFVSNGQANTDSTPFTLTTTFADYTIGGDGNLFGRRVNEELIVDATQELLINNPDEHTVTIQGSESDTTPAYKVYYDPPPAATLNTGWVKFGTNEEDSDNWAIGTPSTRLLSGQTGTLFFFPSTNADFYFIFKDPDSFNVPSNATITGIQFRGEFALTAPTDINGKLSLSDFNDSDITDDFFSLATGVDPSSTSPYITGSYDNLFGLTLSPDDLSDLYLGIKLPPIVGGTLGEIEGTTEAPAVKIFYTPSPTPTGTGINSSTLSSGTITLTSGRITIQ